MLQVPVPIPTIGTIWRIAALALGLAAAVPLRTGSFDSHPQPATSYDDAILRADRRRIADDTLAAPGGASVLMTHGYKTARVVVLLHGFTDSPRQFQPLADRLFAEGDNVYVPRLPHHAERGGDARTLAQLTGLNLRNASDSVIDLAHGLGDSVVVLGLSVGGTMAAWIAQHRSDVQRAVLVAPALQAGRVPGMLERPLVDLSARIPNVTHRAAPDTARPDHDAGFTTHAVAQILHFGMTVMRSADRSAPGARSMSFLLNANDRTVKESAARSLANSWSRHGAPVMVYELPDSLRLPHNIVDRPGGGPPILTVLELLAHGETPAPWVRTLSTH